MKKLLFLALGLTIIAFMGCKDDHKAAEVANEKLRAAGMYGRVMSPKCGQWFDFSMGLQARS